MAAGYFGLYTGTVIRSADPEVRGRLILQVPSVTGFRQTNWAESSHPAGFPSLAPQPGDPVWVQFEGGDTARPVWTGIPGASSFAGGGAASVAFDSLTVGTLTVTTSLAFGATGDYFVGANRYAFRYTPAPNYGLLFNATAGAYQFTNGSATSTFSIDANGGGFTAAGVGRVASYFYAHDGAAGSTRIGELYGSAGLFTAASHMYFDANGNDFRWSSNNVERMRLSAAGRLTITAGARIDTNGAGSSLQSLQLVETTSSTSVWLRARASGGGGGLEILDSNFANVNLSITNVGAVNTRGNLTENGQRVYSPNNPQPVVAPSAATAMMLMGA